MPLTISSLFTYPVKSCAGIELQSAILTPFGIRGDRQWMVVDDDGRMLTQRANAKLALIQPKLTLSGLKLSHPSSSEIAVKNSELGEHVGVSVWKDKVYAQSANKEVGQWLTDVTESPKALKLVRFDQDNIRLPAQPERFGLTARHFADAAPYLVANTSSLDSLNAKLRSEHKPTVSVQSFRPNIVFSGLAAFEEHRVSGIALANGSSLRFIDHCERCIVITVDPATGLRRERNVPYPELASLNSMPGKPKAAAFGANATLSSDSGSETLSVAQGDSCNLLV